MELQKARAIAEKLKGPVQLGFALEPTIEIAGRRFPLDERVQRRFWAKVHRTDNCWLWLGAKSFDGYGSFNVGGCVTHAQRVAYTLKLGNVPVGVSVLHTCDNPGCIRPDHLFLGTPRDNVIDMHQKGRARKAHGDRNGSRTHRERRPRGDNHPFRLYPNIVPRGEKVNMAKLKTEQISQIRERAKQGLPRFLIARDFGVTSSTISKVVLGRTWRHV